MRAARWMALALALAPVAGIAMEQGFERIQYRDWRIRLKDGFLAYQNKQYDRAFELLRRNACAGDKQEVEAGVARQRFAAPGAGLRDDRNVGWYRAHCRDFSFSTQGRRTESPMRKVGSPERPGIPRSGITRSVPPDGGHPACDAVLRDERAVGDCVELDRKVGNTQSQEVRTARLFRCGLHE